MEMAKFVHKSVNHSLPKYFQTYFHKVSLAHKRSTRSSSSDNLAMPLFRTSRAQRSIKGRRSGIRYQLLFNVKKLKRLRKHNASKYWLHIKIDSLDFTCSSFFFS